MMRRIEPQGYWCDVCHQPHYQTPPRCRERRERSTFTPQEREAVINSIISSQALSGLTMPREEVERALDEMEGKPLPEIG